MTTMIKNANGLLAAEHKGSTPQQRKRPLDKIRSKFHPTTFHTAYSLKSNPVLFSDFLQILYIIHVKEDHIPDVRNYILLSHIRTLCSTHHSLSIFPP